MAPDTEALRAAVDDVPYWYHTLELAPGVITPGPFALRGAVDRLPWPDLTGKRCLDVATFDGFYAFEMERRGAAEVVAIDIDDAADLDWLPRQVPPDFARGQERIGLGFRLAHETKGSTVKRITNSVYHLDPDELGTFDFVMCGALMQHLRDPFLAMQSIRRVCAGQFMSVELVDPWSSLFNRRPMQAIELKDRTWAVVNVRGHRAMVTGSGFDMEETDLFGMPFGPGFKDHPRTLRHRFKWLSAKLSWRLVGDSTDPPFSVILSHPSPGLAPMP